MFGCVRFLPAADVWAAVDDEAACSLLRQARFRARSHVALSLDTATAGRLGDMMAVRGIVDRACAAPFAAGGEAEAVFAEMLGLLGVVEDSRSGSLSDALDDSPLVFDQLEWFGPSVAVSDAGTVSSAFWDGDGGHETIVGPMRVRGVGDADAADPCDGFGAFLDSGSLLRLRRVWRMHDAASESIEAFAVASMTDAYCEALVAASRRLSETSQASALTVVPEGSS